MDRKRPDPAKNAASNKCGVWGHAQTQKNMENSEFGGRRCNFGKREVFADFFLFAGLGRLQMDQSPQKDMTDL